MADFDDLVEVVIAIFVIYVSLRIFAELFPLLMDTEFGRQVVQQVIQVLGLGVLIGVVFLIFNELSKSR